MSTTDKYIAPIILFLYIPVVIYSAHLIFSKTLDNRKPSGWEVVYDKPGYCETYKANYTFTKKK